MVVLACLEDTNVASTKFDNISWISRQYSHSTDTSLVSIPNSISWYIVYKWYSILCLVSSNRKMSSKSDVTKTSTKQNENKTRGNGLCFLNMKKKKTETACAYRYLLSRLSLDFVVSFAGKAAQKGARLLMIMSNVLYDATQACSVRWNYRVNMISFHVN